MSSLMLRNVPNDLLGQLQNRAREQRRTLKREAIILLVQALAPDTRGARARVDAAERDVPLAAWERLGGRWPGGDAALDALVADIYDARTEGREADL